MHAPVNPVLTFTAAPIGGTLLPATARHLITGVWLASSGDRVLRISVPSTSATAAPVPRVMEHARLAINVSAAVRSPVSDLNSYCTVVEVEADKFGPDSTSCAGSGSRLSAT